MIQWNKDDLFYVCSMIEFVARKTHNRDKDIVSKLSDNALKHQLKAASVNHCLSFEQVSANGNSYRASISDINFGCYGFI